MWSADTRSAWRIVDDGLEVAEISLDEARAIAEKVGEGEHVPALASWRHSQGKSLPA
jgi:hypothetical protein